MFVCSWLAIVNGHGSLFNPTHRIITPGYIYYKKYATDWNQEHSTVNFGTLWFFGRFFMHSNLFQIKLNLKKSIFTYEMKIIL